MKRVLLALALALAGCGDDVEAVERAQRAGDTAALPTEAIGGGLDETTGRPFGYPADVPMVPDPVIVSGGIVPGSISTAIVRYPTPMERYLEALGAALAADGFVIVNDEPSVSGGRRIRVRKERREASFVVTPEGGTTRVDVVATPAPTPESPPAR